jgi:hypothetical protein
VDTVTLVLAGDVPVDQFSTAVSGLARLLQGLTHELADQQRIRWSIDQLDSGSATIAVRGYAEADPEIVQRVVHAYGLVGKALATGDPVPFAQRTADAAYAIVGAINKDVHSITFETPDIDYVVSARPALQRPPAEPRRLEVPVAYGSVQGRLQTLSSRGRLRFTLYDLVHDKAVSCYLRKGDEDLVRERWGRLVTVEGYISRDPLSGRPLAIRRISAIRDIVEDVHSDYRRARGVLRDKPSPVTVDQALRTVRDA